LNETFERDEYNPLTNNDQMVEIMEKLLRKGYGVCVNGWGNKILFEYQILDCENNVVAEGKTINEAVCNAAYEHYKAVK